MLKPGPKQIPLPLGLPSEPSFTNFIPGRNQEAKAVLRDAATGKGERVVCLWGEPGAGKSHLLNAVCREATRQDRTAVYLPCRPPHSMAASASTQHSRDQGTPQKFLDRFIQDARDKKSNGFGQANLICIDDIDTLAGDRAWEDALFHLYNLLETRGAGLLVAGAQNPAGAVFSLRDLGSRLAAGLVIRLYPLDEDDKRMALERRAEERGFTLTDGVIAFLLRRCHRDMHSLFALLDEIDEASLVEKRRVTIPFVSELLRHQTGAAGEE
uniref:Regulatory inactivation of DnaA Hda protein n=1 Tax=Candidatus Kentrum eta TaxID=2126337 RepID=A0A450VII6_9GAMM|nr:MAG: regulatory inactivation of DnaA Hda protein [Candidatus Kentron sp. H]VFK04624.1 MAG: regulatory inactivation of DnaA Hda protein [Candidatus Kentron sp. H]VFK08295.1 MAG: regulatory inactivation of DnaA Hda protein [Candidatus Kentron sp. H]